MCGRPLISIVIPCYNQGQYVEEAIHSIQTSTYTNYEIIVVDDGSTDPLTVEILNRIDANHNVSVIRQSNMGLPGARNTGIRLAGGEYIVPLDADDVIYPSFLLKAAWRLSVRPETGIVYCLVQMFGDEQGIWYTDQFDADLILHHNFIPATAMFRRKLWEDVGGYDESMRFGYEDWEFWIRSTQAGWKAERLNEALFGYRRHGLTMLHESRKHHEEIIGYVRAKHSNVYTIQWKMRLGFYYSRRKLMRIFRRVQSVVKRTMPNTVRRSIKQSMYRIRPKRLKPLPPARNSEMGQKVLREVGYDPSQAGVVVILPWLQVGGVERVMINLLTEIDRSRFRVYLFTTLKSEHPWERKFDGLVNQVFHLASMCDTDQDRVNFLCDFIVSNKISCVHISNSEFGYAAAAVLKKSVPNIGIVDTLHMEEPYEPWDYMRLSSEVKQYIDKRVTVTRSLRERLISIYGESADRVVVIENGIDPNVLGKGKRGTSYKDAIVFVGRFVEQKQPLTFVDIAIRLLESDKSLRFVMVGDGPLGPVVQQRISKFGIGDHVALEHSAMAWEVLRDRALMLVAPSLWEGLPMIGLESMALRVPIVASNVPGWADLIESSQDGVLVTSGRVAEFCNEIVHLLRNEDVRKHLSDNAYVKLERLYSAHRMSCLYQEQYLSLSNR